MKIRLQINIYSQIFFLYVLFSTTRQEKEAEETHE